MKLSTLLGTTLLFTTATAHSWLECVRDEAKNYAAVKQDPSKHVDVECHGFPRNKVNNGDWIRESSAYLWDLAGERASKENGGRHACHPTQRKPTYPGNAKATKAKAGETLRLRFWGNGHTSYGYGRPLHKDPGLVRVYYAGRVNKEIKLASQLTVDKMMVESNFSADAVSRPKEGNNPDDKANWMQLHIPSNFQKGRHMFVWTWASIKDDFAGGWRNQYTTCFDVFVDGKVNGKPDPAPPKPKKQNTKNDVKAKCAKPCFKGGQKQFPCSGGNCPPCRFGENCFEYNGGKCPAWAGGFDCKKGKAI